MRAKVSVHRMRHGDGIPDFKPSRYRNASGYVVLRWLVSAGVYWEVYEHRAVMGLPPDHLHVHHRNGIKSDNRPENLEVVTLREHRDRHLAFDIQAASRDYALGMSYTQLGVKYGRSGGNIMRALKLRGVQSRPKPSREQTHCVNGHEFTLKNTRMAGGQRHCRACCRERAVKHYHRDNPSAAVRGPYVTRNDDEHRHLINITGTSLKLSVTRGQ